MRRITVDFVVLLAVIVLASAYICHQALQIFDFYDMAIFLDAGYRVWRGQKIYVDFFYIAGPVHPYLYALFFTLFGFTKTAVQAYLCTTQAAAITAVYFIARRRLGVGLSAALGVLTCLSMFGPIAHPWYDQTAITFFLVASAVMLAGNPERGDLRRWLLPAICGGLMGLSFLSKSNIGLSGGGMLLLGYLVLARRARNYKPVLAYIAGGLAVLALLILTLASPSAYFHQNFVYFSTAARITDLSKLGLLLLTHPFIPMAVAAAIIARIGGRQWCQEHLPELVLLIATWVTGLFSAWTGSVILSAYCFFWAPILVYLCLLAAALPNRMFKPVRIISWLCTISLILLALPHQLKVWSWQPHDADGDYTLRSAGFAGWHCRGDIGQGLDQVVDYINRNVPRSDSILVLPDCGIIYGLTGHDSYRKMPWAYNIDISPGNGPMYTEMMKHLNANPPQWIVVRMELLLYPIPTVPLLAHFRLKNVLATQYEEIAGPWPDFIVFKRNAPEAQH